MFRRRGGFGRAVEGGSPKGRSDLPGIERMFYSRGSDGPRRAACPHELLVPRRRLAGRRAGGACCRAGALGPGRHRPPGPLRGRQVHGGGAVGRPAWCHRAGDRAARPGRSRPSRPRHPGASGPPTGWSGPDRWPRRRVGRERERWGPRSGRRAVRGRGAPGSPPPRTAPAARPSRAPTGGPAGDRRGSAGPAPRPAGPRRSRLPEPLPARLPGQPGRDQGGPPVHPGAPGRARRGARRAVRLPARRDRPSAPGR